MQIDDQGRPNRKRAAKIDDVLAKLPRLGREAAARELNSAGVPFAVICRVISEPRQRRKHSLTSPI